MKMFDPKHGTIACWALDSNGRNQLIFEANFGQPVLQIWTGWLASFEDLKTEMFSVLESLRDPDKVDLINWTVAKGSTIVTRLIYPQAPDFLRA